MRLTRIIPTLLLFLFCFVGFVAAENDNSWVSIAPEEAGYDADKLKLLDRYMLDNTGTTGLMLVHDGKVFHSYGDLRQVSLLASCRKSVLSLLYGIYVSNGTIDLSQTVGELGITDHGGLLPIEQTATVKNLISSNSGVYHPAANPSGMTDGMEPPRGSVRPGTRFFYNNWDFNVAGTVFTMLTKKSLLAALQEDLAVPLGMEDFDQNAIRYSGDPERSQHLAYVTYLSTRDMARIGQLMLNRGRWNGKQIVPEAWIDESVSLISKLDEELHVGYGYMWWRLKDYMFPEEFDGAYSAKGMYGQYITVFPKIRLVIAHKSGQNAVKITDESQYREIMHLILNARKK